MRTLLLCLLIAAPVAGVAAQETSSSFDTEAAAERSCDRHQNPRRCMTTSGTVAFECRVKSPVAGVLHMLHRKPQAADDDVVVTRTERSDRSPARPIDGPTDRSVERRVERGNPIPQCKN